MKGDKAKHNIQPPSRFGVVELTRQRVRPETDIKTTEACPTWVDDCASSRSLLSSLPGFNLPPFENLNQA